MQEKASEAPLVTTDCAVTPSITLNGKISFRIPRVVKGQTKQTGDHLPQKD
jgi:hypothetical protein